MKRSALFTLLFLLCISANVAAVSYEPVPASPCGLAPPVANSSGLLFYCHGDGFYYRPDGGSWGVVFNFSDPADVLLQGYAITDDRLIYAALFYDHLTRDETPRLRERDLSTGEYLDGQSCSPSGEEICRVPSVFGTGGEIFALPPRRSAAFARRSVAGWTQVEPPLHRWVLDPEICPWNCAEGAPVSVAAQAAGESFAYGDIQHYLEAPIGDFVRTQGGSWTDANMDHDGPVLALHNFGGVIYAGGEFGWLDGQSTPAVARWTGSTWAAVLPQLAGTPAVVRAFAEHQGLLFFIVELTVAKATSYQLWASNGLDALLVDPSAPAGSVVATATELYIAGSNSLDRVVGNVVATQLRSFSELKELFRN